MDDRKTLRTRICIIGGGLTAHTAAIYAARADLKPILFESCMSNKIAPGGRLTTTTHFENFPVFPQTILMANYRMQSDRFHATILSEMVNKVDFSATPFKISTEEKTVLADSVVVATGTVARRLHFTGTAGLIRPALHCVQRHPLSGQAASGDRRW
ncbi:hypothetical protein TB2_026305 [Malus domestica]